MKRTEFMDKLERELRSRKVPEPEDILAEYRRHFEYKLADGYSEEETATRRSWRRSSSRERRRRLGELGALGARCSPGRGWCLPTSLF